MFKIKAFSKLVNIFEAKPFPLEAKILKTTIQVGVVRYRRCAYLFFTKEGLYLSIKILFKNYPIIFIPWTSIEENRKARLYGRNAIQLNFKESLPSIKIYESDFNDNFNDMV